MLQNADFNVIFSLLLMIDSCDHELSSAVFVVYTTVHT